jgi:hypothetical protein
MKTYQTDINGIKDVAIEYEIVGEIPNKTINITIVRWKEVKTTFDRLQPHVQERILKEIGRKEMIIPFEESKSIVQIELNLHGLKVPTNVNYDIVDNKVKIISLWVDNDLPVLEKDCDNVIINQVKELIKEKLL